MPGSLHSDVSVISWVWSCLPASQLFTSIVPSHLPCADPWLWSEQQVCQWLLWATNEFSLVNVNLQRFGMNGQMLCNLGKERFLELAPDFVGDILWEHLEQMIKGKAGLGEAGTQMEEGGPCHLRLPSGQSPLLQNTPERVKRGGDDGSSFHGGKCVRCPCQV